MTRIASVGLALSMLAWGAMPANASSLSERAPVPASLQWQGEEHWHLFLGDEAGDLRLGFIQTPAGDYQISGSLTLDDAELGVTGSGRWRGGRLLLDLVVSGAVRDAVPDPGKQRLYPADRIPERIDAAGFAVLRAELDGGTLNGRNAQYQTNVVTGNRLQGPVLRLARLEHRASP